MEKKTFAGIMGIIFVVLGVVGAIGIWASFDWQEWEHVKHLTLTQSERIAIMEAQRNTTLIMMGVTLLGNLAIGSVLLALDKIINLLQTK